MDDDRPPRSYFVMKLQECVAGVTDGDRYTVKTMRWLWCGPLAALVLASGIAILPFFVPGYSQVRQTVSEIGERGSPAQIPFSLMLLAVAALILLFSIGVHRISARRGHGVLGACFVGVMSITLTGIALYPFPDPLHNVFGISELVGYQAPLVIALQWRKDPKATQVVTFAWSCFFAQWTSLAVNFVVFFRDSHAWELFKPAYGLVQRSLFLVFCIWLVGAGLLLRQLSRDADIAPHRV